MTNGTQNSGFAHNGFFLAKDAQNGGFGENGLFFGKSSLRQ